MKRSGEWRGKGSGKLWGPPMLEGKDGEVGGDTEGAEEGKGAWVQSPPVLTLGEQLSLSRKTQCTVQHRLAKLGSC